MRTMLWTLFNTPLAAFILNKSGCHAAGSPFGARDLGLARGRLERHLRWMNCPVSAMEIVVINDDEDNKTRLWQIPLLNIQEKSCGFSYHLLSVRLRTFSRSKFKPESHSTNTASLSTAFLQRWEHWHSWNIGYLQYDLHLHTTDTSCLV